jgi:hypothetical protein
MSSFLSFSGSNQSVTTTWTGEIDLSYSQTQTVPAASGALIPRLKPGITPATDAVVTWLIPAGNATSMASASLQALNVVGDAFNAAHYMVLQIGTEGATIRGILSDLGTVVSTSPTLSAATVDMDVNRAKITLTFDRACYIPNLTALSLNFSVGTTRTITAIASGNGTTTIALTLSGSVATTDSFSLVVTNSNIQDVLGHYLADSSISATLSSYSIPSQIRLWRGDVVTNSSGITVISDQTGSAHLAPATATKATVTTLGPNAMPAWDHGTGSPYYADIASFTPSAGSMLCVIDLAALSINPNGQVIATLATASGVSPEVLLFEFYDAGKVYFRRHNAAPGDIQTGIALTLNPCTVLATWDATGAELWIDGVQILTSAVPETISACVRCVLGGYGDFTASLHFKGKMAETRIGTSRLSTPQVASAFAYASRRYGL